MELLSVQGQCRGSDVVLQGDSREGVDNGGERGEEVELLSVQGQCRRA